MKNILNQISAMAVVVLLLFIAIAPAPAQKLDSAARTRFGVWGQYAYTTHYANFKELPDIKSCCENFRDAIANNFAAGLLYDIPFSNVVGLSLRLGYVRYAGVPSWIENTDSTVFSGAVNPDGSPANVPFQHTIEANLGNIGFEPFLTIKPFTGLSKTDDGLTIMLGGHLGYAIQRDFRMKEEIIGFPNVRFLKEGARVRNDTSGIIPGSTPYSISVMAGLSWEIPLNAKRTVYITPEVFYSYPITPIVQGSAWTNPNNYWNVHQIRAGISLKFAPERKVIDTTQDTPPQREVANNEPPPNRTVTPPSRTTTPEKSTPEFVKTPENNGTVQRGRELTASMTAVGVERDGRELPDVTFRVEEFLSVNLRPLLPFVFFEQGSDNIPDRYERLSMRDTSAYNVNALHNYEMLETYHQILNIVGKRMKSYPRAKLTITGCNDNTPAERTNAGLTFRRAKAVRDYLANVWGIDTARMPLQTRNLPAMPTVSNTGLYANEVVQENRRVEFASDTWEVLEPVKTMDTVRTVSPPIIRFRPRVVLPVGDVKEWTITVKQQGQTLKEFRGVGSLPKVLDWNIAENQATIPRAPVPLDYTLSVVDTEGNRLSSEGASPVEQITIQRKRRERIKDKEIDRYSLILFDFDKSNLTATQDRIAQYIKKQIGQQATVRISGYTDYTNPLDYSLRLSKARARETASSLDLAKRAEVRGLGKTVLLYDTDIPEGRFYCRTVTIIVETPVQE
jgi:outer membrane protein OmpA-like peptidoglycan-associated protein